LRGFPASTVQACAEFQQTRGGDAFDRALAGVIQHHLRQPAAQPVAEMPGSTRLVADLGLDSLTMAELSFLFEDLFDTQIAHEDFQKVVTLDDLRGLLRAKIPGLNQG
jgi:acyl carrier protein